MYQLVIKFWRSSLEDESFIKTFESDLSGVLSDTVEWDGYDLSGKEINLFINTPEPKPTFRKIHEVLKQRGVTHGVSAASRLVGGAHFTSIWPLRSTRKFKLP